MLSDCHCPISSGWRFHLHNQAASTTSTASEATAAPATARNFFDDFMYSNVFLVEDIECRQIHDRDFFLMESDSVTRRDVFRRYICPDPLVFADGPPANAKDIPAIPNSGIARLTRFRLGLCFVCDIPTFCNTLDPKISTNGPQDFAVQNRSLNLSVCTALNALWN